VVGSVVHRFEASATDHRSLGCAWNVLDKHNAALSAWLSVAIYQQCARLITLPLTWGFTVHHVFSGHEHGSAAA
jgi:hypothetical protein